MHRPTNAAVQQLRGQYLMNLVLEVPVLASLIMAPLNRRIYVFALVACLFARSTAFVASPVSSAHQHLAIAPTVAKNHQHASQCSCRRRHAFQLNSASAASASSSTNEASSKIPITIQKYEYDNWKLTYRYRPPSPGYEAAEPLILIHPVGIGLSSWFWEKFMAEWTGGALYAPNLIGCGLEDGNDKWDPDERGMSVPLAWVKAVEALIQEKAMAPATIIAQGGCAPIGVLLASRNPNNIVSKLVLTSPPTWDDMATATPQEDLDSSYNFYRSKWGTLAFKILENEWAVRLFSNLFLFLEECDDRWIELSTSKEATTKEARPPVMIFNSGFLQHRSYEEELRELEQPTLIVSGSGDKRAEKREKFGSEMKYCTLISLEGTNVLPWEAPVEVCEAIQSFSKNVEG